MPRRHYLVSYDIADDKQRTRVFKTLEELGNHVQYSVFLCELNRRELVEAKSRMDACIDHASDQILFVDLGPRDPSEINMLEVLGRSYEPPTRVQIV